MTVFPIHLLIAFGLCGFSNFHYGQASSCPKPYTQTKQVYAKPKDNEIDCRQTYHADTATYNWTWYDADRRLYVVLPSDQNITTSGSRLSFDLFPLTKQFKCDISEPGSTRPDTILYDVIEGKLIQTNPNSGRIYYNVSEYSFLSVPCSVEGFFLSDDLYFIWYLNFDDFDAMFNDTARTFVDARGNLNFSPVLKTDELYRGSRMFYHCVVKSPKLDIRFVGPKVLIYVSSAAPGFVHSRPLLQYITPDVIARVNDSIILECVFSNDNANSLLTYKWYSPNGERLRRPSRFTFYYTDEAKQRLYLSDLTSIYQGYWYCGADNANFSSYRQGISVKVFC